MNRYLKLLLNSLIILIIAGCSYHSSTNQGSIGVKRKQFMMVPSSQVNNGASLAYTSILTDSNKKHLLNKDKKTLKRLQNILNRLIPHTAIFKPDASNWKWEVNLIQSKQLNAWCMPGGKIAVYTGMLDITKNKHGLAAVMGHEIAHAVAKHSIERASRALVLNVGTAALDIFTGGAISNTRRTTGVDVAGMLRRFGIDNPFGRKQEREADYLGLIFSSLAGFDIRESVKVWERMKESHEGQEPPEWMSAHPSSAKRIESLKNWIPEIIIKYPPIKKIS